MSENAEQTAPVAETKEPVVAGEQPKGNGEDKPDGTQSVVFTPEQEARFKRIYGNMKQYERINNSLIEQNRILLEKFEKLETDTRQKTWNELREEKRKALESGEHGRVVDIDDKLAELREAPKEKRLRRARLRRLRYSAPNKRKISEHGQANLQATAIGNAPGRSRAIPCT